MCRSPTAPLSASHTDPAAARAPGEDFYHSSLPSSSYSRPPWSHFPTHGVTPGILPSELRGLKEVWLQGPARHSWGDPGRLPGLTWDTKPAPDWVELVSSLFSQSPNAGLPQHPLRNPKAHLGPLSITSPTSLRSPAHGKKRGFLPLPPVPLTTSHPLPPAPG